MHPVLKVELERLAEEVRGISLEEAQVHPQPGQGRWCPQQVIEHLVLSYKMTTEEIGRQLAKGQPAKRRRGLLGIFLRLQTIGLGVMPHGIPSTPRLKPRTFDPLSGAELAERLLARGEEMDVLLGVARRKFGIQPCGEHPFYGPLRVDEWRRYHALHARHHLKQLQQAIKFAKGQQSGEIALKSLKQARVRES